MARPAGLSSDEDDLDGFADESYSKRVVVRNVEDDENKKRELAQNKFMLAIMNENIEEVESIVASDSTTVDAPLRDGWTPLMLAASVGSYTISKLLIALGANVNYDKDKCTILMAACKCTNASDNKNLLEIVKLLVEHGANVKAITRTRMTALMYACSSGLPEVVEFLLPLSNKFACDNQGWTALFWAVNDGRVEVVKFLLEQGYSDTDVDVRRNTPLHYAVQQDLDDIVDLLPSKKNQETVAIPVGATNFYEEFCEQLKLGDKPKLFNDICSILYGIRCENVAPKFSNTGLREFLCLTDEKLQEIGINMPFQRYRILAGLYRFHRYPFKPKSVPIVVKHQQYNNVDALESIIASVRQFIAMEASVEYISGNLQDIKELSTEEIQSFETSLKNIKGKLARIKCTSEALLNRTKYWNLLNTPADYINKDSKRSMYSIKRRLVVFSVIVAAVYGGFRMFQR